MIKPLPAPVFAHDADVIAVTPKIAGDKESGSDVEFFNNNVALIQIKRLSSCRNAKGELNTINLTTSEV
jgi:hypothetical protein